MLTSSVYLVDGGRFHAFHILNSLHSLKHFHPLNTLSPNLVLYLYKPILSNNRKVIKNVRNGRDRLLSCSPLTPDLHYDS